MTPINDLDQLPDRERLRQYERLRALLELLVDQQLMQPPHESTYAETVCLGWYVEEDQIVAVVAIQGWTAPQALVIPLTRLTAVNRRGPDRLYIRDNERDLWQSLMERLQSERDQAQQWYKDAQEEQQTLLMMWHRAMRERATTRTALLAARAAIDDAVHRRERAETLLEEAQAESAALRDIVRWIVAAQHVPASQIGDGTDHYAWPASQQAQVQQVLHATRHGPGAALLQELDTLRSQLRQMRQAVQTYLDLPSPDRRRALEQVMDSISD